MKYFLDTEFLEGTQKTLFGQSKPTIDLISIGIVCEDGREYYAISKDFNLKKAWNRYDYNEDGERVYWLKENVLKPIWVDLYIKDNKLPRQTKILILDRCLNSSKYDKDFTFKEFKRLINKYGKTNKQITEEIIEFTFPTFKILKDGRCNCNCGSPCPNHRYGSSLRCSVEDLYQHLPKFYGYYSDYDWVVFCWLFGKMIDLPKGFPMYCIDLKQSLDEKVVLWADKIKGIKLMDFESQLDYFKKQESYPKQTNEHDALTDAKWNYELYKFLNTL